MLLVALPFQGFAATSMPACGPLHDLAFASVAGAVEPTASYQHVHGAGESRHQSASSGHAPHFDAKAKCNNCATCCAGAALIGDVTIHIPAPANDVDFHVITHAFPPVPVDTLDRPPRTILA